ncbi:cysteine proteinase inhibitor 1, partial [Phtheirospermum japonicum]
GDLYLINDLKRPEIVKLAKFAVAKHNKEANTSLSFVRIVRGDEQPMGGITYWLDIFANDGNIYRAVIDDLMGPQLLTNLLSFYKIEDQQFIAYYTPKTNDDQEYIAPTYSP